MNSGETQAAGQHLILYDGFCGLCNRWIGRILARDPRGLFHFAPLQSEVGRSLLRQSGKNPELLDTIYIFVNYKSESSRVLTRARAALFVISRLDSPWKFLKVFELLPTSILDAAYSLVAQNRYRLFGKYDRCPLPPARHKDRFIDA